MSKFFPFFFFFPPPPPPPDYGQPRFLFFGSVIFSSAGVGHERHGRRSEKCKLVLHLVCSSSSGGVGGWGPSALYGFEPAD